MHIRIFQGKHGYFLKYQLDLEGDPYFGKASMAIKVVAQILRNDFGGSVFRRVQITGNLG